MYNWIWNIIQFYYTFDSHIYTSYLDILTRNVRYFKTCQKTGHPIWPMVGPKWSPWDQYRLKSQYFGFFLLLCHIRMIGLPTILVIFEYDVQNIDLHWHHWMAFHEKSMKKGLFSTKYFQFVDQNDHHDSNSWRFF